MQASEQGQKNGNCWLSGGGDPLCSNYSNSLIIKKKEEEENIEAKNRQNKAQVFSMKIFAK